MTSESETDEDEGARGGDASENEKRIRRGHGEERRRHQRRTARKTISERFVWQVSWRQTTDGENTFKDTVEENLMRSERDVRQ